MLYLTGKFFQDKSVNKFLSSVVFSFYRNPFLLFRPITLFFSLYKSVLPLLSRLAPKCQFSLSFTPTCIPTVRCFFMLMPRYAFFFFLINSGFESLLFPLYPLFYPFYHHPSNLPLLLNVLSLLQVFLKLHLLLLLLFMHSIYDNHQGCLSIFQFPFPRH